MHPARPFRVTDPAALAAVFEAHPLATVIAAEDGRPRATHTPVLVERTETSLALRFHLSAASALRPLLDAGARVLLIATGPDAYISPDWYGVDDQVPTWTYQTAEVEGPPERLTDAGATAFLDDLSARFEAGLAPKPPWTRRKMSLGKFEAMLRGIAAYRLVPDRLEGVLKLSQNKPAAARAGVAEALGPGHPIGRLMRRDLE